MTRGELASSYFKDGYNCAQSVLLAFLDKTGFDKETALKVSSSFGGGMGRLREVCGAVSGIFMVLGIVEGYSSNTDNTAKMEHYAKVQKLANEFKTENGSIVCRELLGVKGAEKPTPEQRTDEYYKKRPCAELVRMAADILEKYFEENK